VVLVLTRSCAAQIDIDFLHIHEDKVLPPHKFHLVVAGILMFSLCAFAAVLINTLALTRLFSGVGQDHLRQRRAASGVEVHPILK
jgi:hypothetical protein